METVFVHCWVRVGDKRLLLIPSPYTHCLLKKTHLEQLGSVHKGLICALEGAGG